MIAAIAEQAARMTAHRKEEFKKDLNAIFDKLDDAFTVEEGDHLLKTLERFENHTDGEENEVVNAMIMAILSPLLRGTTSENGIIAEMINKAIIKRSYLPQMRKFNNQYKSEKEEEKKKLDRDENRKSFKNYKVFHVIKHMDDIIKKVEKDEEEILNKYTSKNSKQRKETNKGERFERKDDKVMDKNNNHNKKLTNNNSKKQHKSNHKRKKIERTVQIPRTNHKKYDRLKQNEYNYENFLKINITLKKI